MPPAATAAVRCQAKRVTAGCSAGQAGAPGRMGSRGRGARRAKIVQSHLTHTACRDYDGGVGTGGNRPGAVVIVITPHHHLDGLLKTGVLTAATPQEAVTAVQRVLSAWSPLEPPLPASALRHLAAQPPARAQRTAAEVELTARERDVLRFLAAG